MKPAPPAHVIDPVPVRSVIRIPLDDIDVSGRLREVSEAHAQVIAQSMREHGRQLQPVEVAANPAGPKPYKLAYGAHRYRARQILEAIDIEAVVVDGDALAIRLAEIDENLIRHELTALDRARFLAERKRIYELAHPEAKHGGDRKSDQVANMAVWSYAADVAEKTNLSERTIRRACALADALSPEAISRLIGTPYADNQAALETLAKAPAKRQVAAVALLLDEEAPAKSVADAFNRLDGRVEKAAKADNKLAKMIDAWGRMSARERGSFLSFLYEGDMPAGWALASELRGDSVQRGAAWSEAAE